MLGLGALVEGYSIVGTRKHIKSFFDLERDEFIEYLAFLKKVKQIIDTVLGNSILTEHGRVGVCQKDITSLNKSHCYHAHHLLFPLRCDIEVHLESINLEIKKYGSILDAYDDTPNNIEYHFYSNLDNSCGVIITDFSVGRQFFRKIVATTLGKLEEADWAKYPNHMTISSALKKVKKYD